MPTIQEQIEALRKKITAYRALLEQGEDFAERIEALEAELRPLVETQGGAFVAGNVQTGGGDYVGRDKIEISVNPNEERDDQRIFRELLERLQQHRFIKDVREVDFMGGYRNNIHMVMDGFYEYCADPINVFTDDELRRIQKDLGQDVDFFNHYLAINSYSTNNPLFSKPFQSQSYDLEKQKEEFDEQKIEIFRLSSSVWKTYEELIDCAKRKGILQ